MSDSKVTPAAIFRGPGGPKLSHLKEKENFKDVKSTLKRLSTYIGGKRKLLIITFLLCIVTSTITIVGTRLNGYTIDAFIKTGDMKGLIHICFVLAIIYLVSVISTFLQNRLMVFIAQKTSAEIRKDLFASIQNLPLKYFDTTSSGDLMSRLTNDIDNINTSLSQSITQLFSGVVTIIGMLIAMLLLSPILTLIGLMTIPLTFFITKFIIRKAQPYFVRQQRQLGVLNGYIEERISGQKLTILFNNQEQTKSDFSVLNKNLTKSAVLAQALSGIMGPINNFINNMTYFIVTVSGVYLILTGFPITIGVIFSFILYLRSFTRPLNVILSTFNMLQSALAGAERVFEVMDEPKEEDHQKAKALTNFEGNVILNNVHFSYTKDRLILKDINLKAEKGKVVAIVGPTGSGKTTIINLLTKFYDIDSGEIFIDGENIDYIHKNSLRKTISLVLQDTFLFSETVRENIRYGNLLTSDMEVENAAKLANAHRFIMQLPDGYDTVLSDNGNNLSHGQRQLLAIARAILARSSILILDEATSSIDTHTEEEIQNALLNLMKDKTTFVIAHRLSTIKNADEIIAIQDGTIIEKGTHYELMDKAGFYANLYNSQFRGIVI